MGLNEKVFFLLISISAVSPAHAAPGDSTLVLLPGGDYVPLYLEKEKTNKSENRSIKVKAFWLDRVPVTNRQYLEFVRKHPKWEKSHVQRIFADSHYLQHGGGDLDSPVVNVSWFAASDYCESQGKRLPTTNEWEYALADNGRDKEKIQQRILDWYAVPNGKLPPVGSQAANGFGIYDLTGSVWEWTSDFNSFMAASDSRDSGQKDLFCGGGSFGTSNPRDYASFMRYSFRASLQGTFTGKNLGFRCAKDSK